MKINKIIVTLLVFLFFKQAFGFNLDAALEKLEDNTKVKIKILFRIIIMAKNFL